MHLFEPRPTIFLICISVLSGCAGLHQSEGQPPSALIALARAPLGDAILTTPPGGSIRIGPDSYRVESLDLEIDEAAGTGGVLTLTGLFDDERGSLSIPIGMQEGEPLGTASLVHRGAGEPRGQWAVADLELFELKDGEAIGVIGTILDAGGGALPLIAVIGFSAGTSTLRVEGDAAFLNGELGSGTYTQVEYLIEHYPGVRTLVFERVPGSLNDEANMETGRLVRGANFTTVLPSEALIASGGVDLFCAGARRIIEGGRIGVHSWGDPSDDVVANELPRDHPAHRGQLRYFREMLVQGEEFYFYTLAAAPFEDVHWMTADEVEQWGLATE